MPALAFDLGGAIRLVSGARGFFGFSWWAVWHAGTFAEHRRAGE